MRGRARSAITRRLRYHDSGATVGTASLSRSAGRLDMESRGNGVYIGGGVLAIIVIILLIILIF